jgi:16S rRNA (cytosine967-C5)-methyltransferase
VKDSRRPKVRADNKARPDNKQDAPGLAARLEAANIVEGVLRQRRALDELLDEAHTAKSALAALEERDRALARALVGMVLRRYGSLRHLIGLFVERGLPANAPRVETALLLGAAQILFLDVPDHAAVDLSVRLAQADKTASHFTGLVNAVLRRIAREGAARLATFDAPVFDTPEWLYLRWSKNYGATTAHAIAAAHSREPALDITVKSGAQAWAEKLGGRVLPTGTVRAIAHGTVTALPGFTEGAWWVQDAAAALPARLLGDIAGRRVADLCAAPGGKTLQLAAAGAKVTALDRSAPRLRRLADNLKRLSLDAEVICADAEKWTPDQPFDAVLLDAPCSSTGTIRRHPDVPWLKRESDIASLAAMQGRLLDRAVAFTRPGGTIVYCTCSLEPEEGEGVITALLERDAGVRRLPISAAEVSGQSEFITADGDLRTLPCQLPDADSRFAGLDGFYAARLEKPVKS